MTGLTIVAGFSGFTLGAGFSILTVCLLLVLTYTWGTHYLEFRTPLALGLVLFCLVLLVENSAALYFYFIADEMFYVDEPTIGTIIAIKRALEFVAVSAFTYVSLR
jgi:hypothetical protein